MQNFFKLILFLSSIAVFCTSGLLLGQTSPQSMGHDVYEKWRSIKSYEISPSAKWLHYEIGPAKGDGHLFLLETGTEQLDSVHRGTQAELAGDESFLAFKIKPHYDTIRQAKIEHVSSSERPQDSLGVWMTGSLDLVKIPLIQSFKVAEKQGSWLAYQAKHPKVDEPEPDSTSVDSSEEKTPAPKGSYFVLWKPSSGDSIWLPKVEEYTVSRHGHVIGFIHDLESDSLDSVCVQLFITSTRRLDTLYVGPGKAQDLVIHDEGEGYQVAYLMTTDTGEVKTYDLMWSEGDELISLASSDSGDLPEGLTVSPDQSPYFSRSGGRLFFGLASIPEPSVEDTIPSDEKPALDVWNWQDSRLQPQQLLERDEDLEHSDLAVIHLAERRMVRLGDQKKYYVRTYIKGDGNFALAADPKRYEIRSSWDAPGYRDYYVVDVNTGEEVFRLEEKRYPVSISKTGRFLLYWDEIGLAWHSIDLKSREDKNLTGNLGVAFFDEEHDIPTPPYPYGVAGWGEEDAYLVLEDKYDLWRVDPRGRKKARRLTQGREDRIDFNYERLDDEEEFLPGGDWMLLGNHEEDKSSGYYLLARGAEGNELTELIHSAHRYNALARAENAETLLFRRQSYREYPELWITDSRFREPKQLTLTNPQQKKYRWGTVEMISWEAFDGRDFDGLLYKPDDFDPSKKYPVLIYFYEKTSDRLHNYSTPAPSRSIIYPSWYNSNGYVVFMPDIAYDTGEPGPDAYNSVVSGAETLIERYPWVDADNIGIQGQSWGGYQVAYLVTRTDMFKAAMAGAPVSNMTSAYGGIRWGSGRSRMFQYERTQSRLGATLWENRTRYIENSPLFYADRVETPLLMMHNDDDGAVPWYQGIEYFVALRRLQKPVWMLVYNGEAHNLRQWPNRVDLSIRMSQFFDHYLKDEPAPKWMTQGVPATQKGKDLGYDLDGEATDRE